jgi:hypothetical protein
MTAERDVSVRLLYRVRTNLSDAEVVDYFVACREVVEAKMLEAWHASDNVDVIAGRGLTLSVLGVVGPSIVRDPIRVLHDEALERWSARVGDSVDEEVEYLRAEDERARGAYEEAVARGDFEYEPERDPYIGETSSRYEEGKMP